MNKEIIELKAQLKALSDKLSEFDVEIEVETETETEVETEAETVENVEKLEKVEKLDVEKVEKVDVEKVKKCPFKTGVCPMSDAVKQLKVCPMKVCPMSTSTQCADFIKPIVKKVSWCGPCDSDIEPFNNDEYCGNCLSNYENSLVLLFVCIILTVVLIILSKKLLEFYVCC